MAKPPEFVIDRNTVYRVTIGTDRGRIVMDLDPRLAPNAVNNFVALARDGYYDGLTFHRVVPEFVIQGGCPEGSGRGGPGYRFDGEFASGMKHDRPGLLSMANAGPGTDGSQFFLTFVPTPWLDGKHTIFGQVEGGEDVLRALESCGSSSGRPSEKLVMEKVTIDVA